MSRNRGVKAGKLDYEWPPYLVSAPLPHITSTVFFIPWIPKWFTFMNPKCASFTVQHSYDSKLLAPALLNWFKLVFGAFKHSIFLEFCTDQLWRNWMYQSLYFWPNLKSSKWLTVSSTYCAVQTSNQRKMSTPFSKKIGNHGVRSNIVRVEIN